LSSSDELLDDHLNGLDENFDELSTLAWVVELLETHPSEKQSTMASAARSDEAQFAVAFQLGVASPRHSRRHLALSSRFLIFSSS
jgi:hypothetical protein